MKTTCFMVAFVVLCHTPSLQAQKPDPANGPVGIFESGTEYDRFMGGMKQAAYGAEGNPELQAMIPLINDIVLNRPVGSTANQYQTNGSTLGLLADASIRKDIEMVDDQYEQLQKVGRDIQRRSAERLRDLDLTDRANLVDQIGQIREQAKREIDEVLLPHQVDRLKQIQMQSLLRRRSLVDVLTSEPLKSNLDISKEQTEQLRKEQEKIQRNLQREIAKLQSKARQQLISKLKPAQRDEVNSMIGDAFEFSNSKIGKSGKKNARNESKGNSGFRKTRAK